MAFSAPAGQGSSAVQLLPPLSWIGVVAVAALLGFRAGGPALAALVAACFGFLAVFGQWESAMVTLASVVVAVPIGVAGGLFLASPPGAGRPSSGRWSRCST